MAELKQDTSPSLATRPLVRMEEDPPIPLKDRQRRLRLRCEVAALKEIEVVNQKTKSLPFPFSLLQMGKPEAERQSLLEKVGAMKQQCEELAKQGLPVPPPVTKNRY